MSAVPVNDDERPLGINAFSAVRTMPGMSTPELHALLGHLIGHLTDRLGSAHAARVATNAIRAAHADDTPLSLVEIALLVADAHAVSVDALRAPDGDGSRSFEFSHPRQEAFWLAWAQRDRKGKRRHSLTQIGKYFGDRDHTTVLYGVRAHSARLLKGSVA